MLRFEAYELRQSRRSSMTGQRMHAIVLAGEGGRACIVEVCLLPTNRRVQA